MDNTAYILVLVAFVAPLISFVTVGLMPSKSESVLSMAALVCMSTAVVSAVALLFLFRNAEPLPMSVDWFSAGSAAFTLDMVLSQRSVVMLAVVAIISFLVHAYSTVYMAGDGNAKRYFAMLGFFTFAMQGIILSDNLLLLFIFWELVGFSSYMLIGHWTSRPAAGRAASKAFILNRIGDAGFLIGLMIVWAACGTFTLGDIPLDGSSGWQTAASLCIFCGVIGKSAQFPLFTWLPDAMEGPTPVSALIHAATMVAAGVYLLVRLFPVFTADALVVVAIVGMITTLAGALAALSQFDVKKVLAYSTMSQLGLMILAIGMGAVDAAFLHLITHAFFKACLFLAAGMVIHALHQAQPPEVHFDVQDIRHLGGLRKKMPFTFGLFLTGGASLAGVPFFSGFLSKEAILTALFIYSNTFSWLMLAVILGVSFLTVLYTFRLLWLMFGGDERTIHSLNISDPGWMMRVPTAILAFCSLWFMVSWNPFDFKGWMLPHQEAHAYGLWITIFSVCWVIAAIALSSRLFTKGSFKTNALFRNAFYVDRVYIRTWLAAGPVMTRGVTWMERKVIDRGLHGMAYFQIILAHVVGWIDRVFVDGAVNGAARTTGFGGKVTRSFQGGNIQLYVFWAVFAIIIFIICAL